MSDQSPTKEFAHTWQCTAPSHLICWVLGASYMSSILSVSHGGAAEAYLQDLLNCNIFLVSSPQLWCPHLYSSWVRRTPGGDTAAATALPSPLHMADNTNLKPENSLQFLMEWKSEKKLMPEFQFIWYKMSWQFILYKICCLVQCSGYCLPV